MSKHKTRTGDLYDYEKGFQDAKSGRPNRIEYMVLDADNPKLADYMDGYYDGFNEYCSSLGKNYSPEPPADNLTESKNDSNYLQKVLEGKSTVIEKTVDETGLHVTAKLNDNVNHPTHYTHGSVECLDAISSALGQDGYSAYLVGNIMKYIWRYKYKNGLEDLQKASFYLDRLIKNEERLILKTEE